MVHQRPAFYASARMYSTRNDNTDSLTNDENKRSHFIADGAFCLMQTGAEYADIYPVWDWQKVPGITCEQREQMPAPAKCRAKGQSLVCRRRLGRDLRPGGVRLQAREARRAQRPGSSAMIPSSVWAPGSPASPLACRDLREPVSAQGRSPLVRRPNGRSANRRRDAGSLSWVWHDRVGYAFLGCARQGVRHARPQKGRWSEIGVGFKRGALNARFQTLD